MLECLGKNYDISRLFLHIFTTFELWLAAVFFQQYTTWQKQGCLKGDTLLIGIENLLLAFLAFLWLDKILMLVISELICENKINLQNAKYVPGTVILLNR